MKVFQFKIPWIIFLVLLQLQFNLCMYYLVEEQDISLISKVLHDIADEFLIKENNDFSIINFDVWTPFLSEVSKHFMSKFNEKHAYFLKSKKAVKSIHIGSAFIFLEILEQFYLLEYLNILRRYLNNPIKIFVFVPHLSFYKLQTLPIKEFNDKIPTLDALIYQYTYFITNDKYLVGLSTVEWFSTDGCDSPNVNMINFFNKRTMEWNSKLENHEKFLQYHGCELVMLLPVLFNDRFLIHASGFGWFNKNQTKLQVYGITPVIFEIAADRHNFTSNYQLGYLNWGWLRSVDPENVQTILINGTEKRPHIYFEISPMQQTKKDIIFSKVLSNLKIEVFVTPAEKYSPYEKFFLPFDLPTWVFVLITFIATFLIIIIINNLSKSTQSIVYGHKVDTPFWNVISIFFGISQTKLPNKNFSRLILIIFIYFCLIFRTCFQSKFFEFLTSEPRRAPPKTISDLIERDYKLYSMAINKEVSDSKYRTEKWPKVYDMMPADYLNALLTQYENSSIKMALTVDEFYLNYLDLKMKKRTHNWNKLKNVIYTSHDVFMFLGFTFYFRMFDKIINDLIPTGIMNHLIENFYTRKLKFFPTEENPKILSLDDLAFGFNIWLCACLISVFEFLFEIIINFVKIRFNKRIQISSFDDKSENISYTLLKPELIQKFKAKKYLNKNGINGEISVIEELPPKMIEILKSIQKIPNREKIYISRIHGSAFIFVEFLDTFYNLEYGYKTRRLSNQAIKYFVFIRFMYFDELAQMRIPDYRLPISRFDSSLYQNAYFITDEDYSIILSTVEWFSPHGCDRPHVYIINTFNKTTMKWDKKLENHEKYLQYHGCELVMLLPTQLEDDSITHVSGYSILRNNITRFDIYGITPEIFKIAAKKHNFTVGYQPASMPRAWLGYNRDENVHIIRINGTDKDPHVYFEISSLHALQKDLVMSNVVTNLNVYIFVTPADKYTPYEKFFLPFDLQTWIFLFITFMSTFLSIIIINNLSKSTQSLVYGQKVYTPFWNVISIFFGISQTKLPNKNFSRFILMLFIYFCLIFRTCFQSKFFEFMTSEPRHPPPKTIDDLIEKNYSVYSLNASIGVFENLNLLEKLPCVYIAPPNIYGNAYLYQSQNSEAKLALVVDQFLINYYDKHLKNVTRWNKLKDFVIYRSVDTFIFLGHAFYFRMFDKIINNLIPTGIMNYLVLNYFTIESKYVQINEDPNVLSLDDLAFGFNISLGFYLISIISFIAEITLAFVKKKTMSLKNIKVHPIIKGDDDEVFIDEISTYEIMNGINLELVEKFRVQKSKQFDISNDLIVAKGNEDIELIDLEKHIAALVLKPIKSCAAIYLINRGAEYEVCIDRITTYEIMKGINPELIEKFRVRVPAQAEVSNDLVTTQIIEDIELIDLEN
ncbi:unnamed protein product [Chironomus riparius]|uniref:Ionotropic glutamate receptor C-terminal domain-containing protein n=1 Tax=Chironomus riparius TaxID=315576 RepID=A0A9N9WPW2_9DIPT|nr:unnamed protein product [Chironomus riparius]